MSLDHYIGKWKGKRVAYVLDYDLGGRLKICFGRLSTNYQSNIGSDMYSKKYFDEWIKINKAKKYETH